MIRGNLMKSLFISILVLMLTACSITPTSETTDENQQQEPIETEQKTKENESKNEPESPAPNYEKPRDVLTSVDYTIQSYKRSEIIPELTDGIGFHVKWHDAYQNKMYVSQEENIDLFSQNGCYVNRGMYLVSLDDMSAEKITNISFDADTENVTDLFQLNNSLYLYFIRNVTSSFDHTYQIYVDKGDQSNLIATCKSRLMSFAPSYKVVKDKIYISVGDVLNDITDNERSIENVAILEVDADGNVNMFHEFDEIIEEIFFEKGSAPNYTIVKERGKAVYYNQSAELPIDYTSTLPDMYYFDGKDYTQFEIEEMLENSLITEVINMENLYYIGTVKNGLIYRNSNNSDIYPEFYYFYIKDGNIYAAPIELNADSTSAQVVDESKILVRDTNENEEMIHIIEIHD